MNKGEALKKYQGLSFFAYVSFAKKYTEASGKYIQGSEPVYS